MAIMCTFAISCIGIMLLGAKVFLGRGLESFNGIRHAIEALKDATIENTEALKEHRNESMMAVERLSREIRERR